ncbi:hypothetical protein F4808DRAFT_96404 [Astrocystis sublimbata]|nr:hypothetical protein F4808DRAFT_96404 [Astrocystis sublimbata]
MEQKQTSSPPQGRQKMNYACEACRAAKTKCQPGPQPDICKRCSEFKRECIFRTGPRTRRPKAAMRAGSQTGTLPPPPGPSKTFSIDFDMQAAEEPEDDFEALRQVHERHLDKLNLMLDGGDEDDEQQQQQQLGISSDPLVVPNSVTPDPKTFSFNDMSAPSPSLSLSGMGPSWTDPHQRKPKSKPIHNLGIKPQFNLDSASKLLASFRCMLPHLPCLVLPEDADIRSLAKSSPFILLAILAVTSCSSSLQGHSLYDEEFRKVLGLKFVAGGERSPELLQGLLIYCSWYPFHLRPKNKQKFQYFRMAVDIVHDLELEQIPELNHPFPTAPGAHALRLNDLRAFLGCYYAMSTYSVTWGKSPSTLRYSPQLVRCAEMLEQKSELELDHHLVWLVRLQYIFEELTESQRNFERGSRDHQSKMQRNLIRAGLEAQYQDFKLKMLEQYASTTSILFLSMLIEAFFLVPPLFRVPTKWLKGCAETVASDHLLHVARKVRAVFDHVASLTPQDFGGLSGADYGRFILSVIMAYRLSFPMLEICRGYDVAQARQIVDLGGILQGIVQTSEDESQEDEGRLNGTGGQQKQNAGAATTRQTRKSDAVSALKVVLQSVKLKFEEKSAAFEAMPTAAAGEDLTNRDLGSMCPMLNGSLDQYIPLWSGQQQQSAESCGSSQMSSLGTMTDLLSTDAGVNPPTPFVGPMGQMGLGMAPLEDKTLMYHDLWATMTMGWAGDMGEVNMDDIGNTGYGDMLGQF